ncbi:MAG: DUF3107 domain-containing protein [Acidimicrobiia bacterium]
MDLRIGMSNVARELVVDLADETDRDKLQADLLGQLNQETGTLRLVDRKGKIIIVPTSKVAYLEIGAADSDRRIGFGG